MRTYHSILSLAVLCGLAACAGNTTATADADPNGPVPRPEHIFVAYFAVAPGQAGQEQGGAMRVDRPNREMLAIRQARVMLATALVERLKQMGLPAEIATNNTGYGDGILIQGQLVNVDESGGARRVLVGAGGGRGRIGADGQLYSVSDAAPPRLLMALQEHSGPPIAAAGSNFASQAADALAEQIGRFAARKGWIARTALN